MSKENLIAVLLALDKCPLDDVPCDRCPVLRGLSLRPIDAVDGGDVDGDTRLLGPGLLCPALERD